MQPELGAWANSPVSKMLGWKHEDLSLTPRTQVRGEVCYVCAIPALGRWRQDDPWGSVARQFDLIGKYQISVREVASKAKVDRCLLKDTSAFHMHEHTYVPSTLAADETEPFYWKLRVLVSGKYQSPVLVLNIFIMPQYISSSVFLIYGLKLSFSLQNFTSV